MNGLQSPPGASIQWFSHLSCTRIPRVGGLWGTKNLHLILSSQVAWQLLARHLSLEATTLSTPLFSAPHPPPEVRACTSALSQNSYDASCLQPSQKLA